MDANTQMQQLERAADHVKGQLKGQPKIGLVLGSGLSDALEAIEGGQRFPFEDIPGFPTSTVAGHAGEILTGTLAGQPVWAQRGRVHFYEGRPMSDVAFPTRLMKLIGVEKLFITNAAGGLNPDYRVGDFVLIRDHINTLPDNPLRGDNLEAFGPRFPNLLDAYSQRLRARAQEAAEATGQGPLKQGVYLIAQGPMYETPAEIKAFARWGADLVGMSTVPEVIAARHAGLEVLGMSVVTNMAAGIDTETELTHEEVLETTQRRRGDFAKLLLEILQRMD